MTQQLWVYKTNSDPDAGNHVYGNWEDVFKMGASFTWGGAWATRSAASRRLIEDEMAVGDLVLAYQTDIKAVVGLCRVAKFSDGRNNLHLTGLEWFDPPVKIHEMKRTSPSLKTFAHSSRGGPKPSTRRRLEKLRSCCVRAEADSSEFAKAVGGGRARASD